jgi:hypothetical protein
VNTGKPNGNPRLSNACLLLIEWMEKRLASEKEKPYNKNEKERPVQKQ